MATIQVNPAILRWARETAGLSLDEAAQKLQLGHAQNLSPTQKLQALEEGLTHPTRPLLLKLSKQYRRPLLTFYLEAPPLKGDRGEDFRLLPDDYAKSDEGLVDALVRDVRARQSIIRAALEDEDEATPLPFVGSVALDDGIEHVSESIREVIGFDLEAFRAQRTVAEAFAYLRAQAESVGLFVLIIGDLGSHHSKISVEAFRGFALADVAAPFVIINDQDSRAAWSFTLLHELSHIWLGQTGISGAVVESTLERFCNDVAGAILMPLAELSMLDVSDSTEFKAAIDRIDIFAKDRNVSRAMVAYKLYRYGAIGYDMWNALRKEFRQQWFDHRAELRRQAQNQKGGPTYYLVKRHRVGKALIEVVSRMTASGAITSTKAGKVLGVKPRNVYEFLQPSA